MRSRTLIALAAVVLGAAAPVSLAASFPSIQGRANPYNEVNLGTGFRHCSPPRAANCNGIKAVGVNLAGRNLRGTHFEKAILTSASFQGANLAGVDFAGADLRGANFGKANLRGANLSHANLSPANLSFADLSHANLSRATLDGADLGWAALDYASLARASLRSDPAAPSWEGYWHGPENPYGDPGATLRFRTVMAGASLRHADTTGADFSGTDLTQVFWK